MDIPGGSPIGLARFILKPAVKLWAWAATFKWKHWNPKTLSSAYDLRQNADSRHFETTIAAASWLKESGYIREWVWLDGFVHEVSAEWLLCTVSVMPRTEPVVLIDRGDHPYVCEFHGHGKEMKADSTTASPRSSRAQGPDTPYRREPYHGRTATTTPLSDCAEPMPDRANHPPGLGVPPRGVAPPPIDLQVAQVREGSQVFGC